MAIGAEAGAPDDPAMANEEDLLAGVRSENTSRTVAASQSKSAPIGAELRPSHRSDVPEVGTIPGAKVTDFFSDWFSSRSIPNASVGSIDRNETLAIRAECRPARPLMAHNVAHLLTSGGIEQLPRRSTHNNQPSAVRTELNRHATPQEGE